MTVTIEAESVLVPNLTGTPVGKAFDEIRSLRLSPAYRDDDFAGKLAVLLPVVWQAPPPGTRVPYGTVVTINAVK